MVAKWLALLLLSGGFVLILEALRLPAALFLGPMVAAILVAAMGGSVEVPAGPFVFAQGVVGCLMARGIPASIVGEIMKDWPCFIAAIVWVVVSSNLLGGLLARLQVLPGTTAIWGSSPGAAMAITLMAEAYGADSRLVAFMQYLRVVMVAFTASLVARIWVAHSSSQTAAVVWFPALDWQAFLVTVLVAGVGAFVARRFRIPAGSLLLPLALGVILQDVMGMTIVLPPWLLAMSYALVGWSIGLRFTRPILVHALRALPRVAASVLALIAVCAVFAAILVRLLGIDPLTAYLATSPGGADSVAIIAASSKVDLPFVMAMQTVRFVVILLIGPSVAQYVVKWIGIKDGAR